MRISTKGRYALRMMVDLAIHGNGEYIPVKTVAARQNISEKYLEQIITVLNRAGCVRSVRGSNGGYMLSKRPEQYTVGQILRLTEGSLAPVLCIEDGGESCERNERCPTFMVWEKIYQAVSDVVDNITLADLVAEQERLSARTEQR